MVGTAFLNRKAYDIFSLFIRFVLSLLFHTADLHGNVLSRIVENGFGELLFSLFFGKTGDLFEFLNDALVLLIYLFLFCLNGGNLSVEVLFLLFEFFLLL